jgi:hypothetical protein
VNKLSNINPKSQTSQSETLYLAVLSLFCLFDPRTRTVTKTQKTSTRTKP